MLTYSYVNMSDRFDVPDTYLHLLNYLLGLKLLSGVFVRLRRFFLTVHPYAEFRSGSTARTKL